MKLMSRYFFRVDYYNYFIHSHVMRDEEINFTCTMFDFVAFHHMHQNVCEIGKCKPKK